jgi:hypothetical protein
MTAPLPPVASMSEVTAEARIVWQDPAFAGNIEAPSEQASCAAEMNTANAEAHAWQGQAMPMMDSAAGFGSGGHNVLMPDMDGDSDWPADVSFGHQGP